MKKEKVIKILQYISAAIGMIISFLGGNAIGQTVINHLNF